MNAPGHTVMTRAAAVLIVTIALSAATYRAQPLALGAIRFYQDHLSTMASRVGVRCRFVPTCSRYAELVIARDGVWRGSWKSLARIARCGPWTPNGTEDAP